MNESDIPLCKLRVTLKLLLKSIKKNIEKTPGFYLSILPFKSSPDLSLQILEDPLSSNSAKLLYVNCIINNNKVFFSIVAMRKIMRNGAEFLKIPVWMY